MVLPQPHDDLDFHRGGPRGGRRRSPVQNPNIRPTRFESRVRYKNDLLLAVSLYPKFEVPAGLVVRVPSFVTAAKMQQLAPQRTLAVVAGLTTVDFQLRFADPSGQWRRRMRGSTRMWEFQGGTVYLDAEIAVYVADGFRPRSPDEPAYYPMQEKLYTVILEHEYLHVEDEVDLIQRFLPAKVRQDGQVLSKLIRRQPLLDRQFHHWIRNRNAEGRTGLGQWIFSDWANEHNRRATARDTGPAWSSYRQRIDTMMRGQADPGP